MSIKLHWKYAVKIRSQWICLNEDGSYYLSVTRANAETRWDIRGAQGIMERYLADQYNITMGDKPEMHIVKIHRPQRINHAW